MRTLYVEDFLLYVHEIKKGFNMNRNRITNQWSAEYAKNPCRSRHTVRNIKIVLIIFWLTL